MKTTIVPAQVTTVEDKIAGNLTFSQLLLLTAPVFMSGAIFALLPPFMNLRSYKLALCLSLFTICLVLAIRVKGRIVVSWIGILGQYFMRPRLYLFDKNDMYLRPTVQERVESEAKAIQKEVRTTSLPLISLPIPELVRAEGIMSDPRARLEFKTTKKGDLRVFIQEIK